MDKQTLYKMCHQQARYLAKNSIDAEDLGSEMFLNILEKNKLEKYDSKKSQFQTWLNRVMKNFMHDCWEKQNRIVYTDDLLFNVVSNEKNAAEILDKKLKIQAIKRLLKTKVTKQNSVIYCLYLHEMTTEETANYLQIKKRNIASYKHRGIVYLMAKFRSPQA